MGSKWSWIFGILTAAAFAFGIVFFAVTQQISDRDWVVLGIGALLGSTLSALVAAHLFFLDARQSRATAEAHAASQVAEAEAARLVAQSEAEVLATATRAAAEAKAIATEGRARAALLARRKELLVALPTRLERLSALYEEIARNRMDTVTADGNAQAQAVSAREAAGHRMMDFAIQQQASAETWRIAKADLERTLLAMQDEQNRLEAMTDEDYVAEQKRLRGLDL